MKFATLVLTITVNVFAYESRASDMLTVNDFLIEARHSQLAGGMLRGANDMLAWTNAYAQQRKGVALYCSPDSIALTDDQVRDITERYLAKNPTLGESPLNQFPYAILLAMVDAFPCP